MLGKDNLSIFYCLCQNGFKGKLIGVLERKSTPITLQITEVIEARNWGTMELGLRYSKIIQVNFVTRRI